MVNGKPPIRILQVVGGAMVHAGIETWLMHVLRHIDRERFHIDIMVQANEPGDYDEEIQSLGCRILKCAYKRKPWLLARKFKRLLSSYEQYDIVHSHTYLQNGFFMRAAKQCGVPSRIAHIHPHVDSKRQTLLRFVYRKLMTERISKYATYVLSPSKSSLNSFREICDCSGFPSEVLYNGIELSIFDKRVDRNKLRQRLNLPVDRPLVSYVSRFVPHKNHKQVFRVAHIAERDGFAAQFAIAGSHGSCLEDLREQAAKRNNVSMLVGVPDISELLLASDLFFFPSLNEGFGIVALEAAAAGLPIVATDLATIREACYPMCHRFLFPGNDDNIAYLNIKTILEDAELQKSMAKEALSWAKKFSIEKSTDHLCSVYENCLKQKE